MRSWCRTGAAAPSAPLWLAAGVVLAAAAAAQGAAPDRMIDLTYTFDASTIYWPTATPFTLTVRHRGPTAAGFWYESNDFAACEHGGTHMDAPCHFARGGWTVDQVPLRVLTGPAVVVDVAAACAKDPDHELSVAELMAWERAHGAIPEASIAFVRTGWGRFWPDRKRYLGTDVKGDVRGLHFPSFGPGAAGWLVRKRRVKMVGIDTASVDVGQSAAFPCHVIFGKANVPALENLANLDRLPATGAHVTALPMKIGSGSGGPVRVIADAPGGRGGASGAVRTGGIDWPERSR
jgi:kynurenine formamidase